MKTVLCIGGLDPAGRAGLLADARAVQAMGARPLCVATALTFQSSLRMTGYEAVPAHTLDRQLEVLLRDEAIDAVKVGQLASADNAAVVSRLPMALPIVLDTPLASSGGVALFPLDALAAYTPLLARAVLVTPNAPELAVLGREMPLETREAAISIARDLGAAAVLVKGGHLPGAEVEDVLVTVDETVSFRSPRLPGPFRGTGCRLASAIAARIAQGDDLSLAVSLARQWLLEDLLRESAQ